MTTTTPTPAARVSGTIKERELYDLWVVADCLMSFCEFKDRILAAIQPDPEPQPVAWAEFHDGHNWCRCEPTVSSTQSSAGTVSVEAAARALLESLEADATDPAEVKIWHDAWTAMSDEKGYAWNKMRAALRALAGDNP